MDFSDGGFKKDVFSMFLGMAMGALIAHSAGYLWILGVLSGGAIGYLTRMLTEPTRIKYAAKRAWQMTTDMYESLFYDWQKRLTVSFQFGIFLGGTIGSVMGLMAFLAAVSGEPDFWFGIDNPFVRYGVLAFITNAIILVFTTSLFYLLERDIDSNPNINTKWLARNLNLVMIHYHVARLAILKIILIVASLPSVFRSVGRFLCLFFRFVHSDDFSACGSYALLGSVAIYFMVPNDFGLILASAFLGSVFGAIVRRLVPQYLLAEPL